MIKKAMYVINENLFRYKIIVTLTIEHKYVYNEYFTEMQQ